MRSIQFGRLEPDKPKSVIGQLSDEARARIIARTEMARALNVGLTNDALEQLADAAHATGLSFDEATEAFQALEQAMQQNHHHSWDALEASIAQHEAEEKYPGMRIDRVSVVPTGCVPIADEKTYSILVRWNNGLAGDWMFETGNFEANSYEEACLMAMEMASLRRASPEGYFS